MAFRAWFKKTFTFPILAGLVLFNIALDGISITRSHDEAGVQALVERYLLIDIDVFNFFMFFSVLMLFLAIALREIEQDIGKFGMFQFVRRGRSRYLKSKLAANATLCVTASLLCVVQSFITQSIAGTVQPFVTYAYLFGAYTILLYAFTLFAVCLFLLTKNAPIAFLISLFTLIILKFVFFNANVAGNLSVQVSLNVQFLLYAALALLFTVLFIFIVKKADMITTKIKE